MVNAQQFEKNNKFIPVNIIKDKNPIDGTDVYWVNSQLVIDTNIIQIDPEDVIIDSIKECCIKYAHKIIDTEQIFKLIELVKKENSFCVENLIPNLISEIDLQKIIINLVKDKVSIRDFIFIFEKLCDYARFSSDPDILSAKLKIDLTEL